MKLSFKTLIRLRDLAIALQKALEEALLETYGWTPRRSTADIDAACYTEGQEIRA